MKFETIAAKQYQAAALLESARVSALLRKTYGLPMDSGKAGYRVTVNGYGEFRRLEIMFNGEVVKQITELSEVPKFVNFKQPKVRMED